MKQHNITKILALLVVVVAVVFAQDTGRNVEVIQTDENGGNFLKDMGTIRLDYGIQPVATCQDSISIDANSRYQKILGFGAAFTESAAYTFSKVTPQQQQEILDAYWNPDRNTSIGYTVARVPIAACDYSLTVHSYDDTWDDTSLNDFSVAYDEDIIIPFIQAAYKASGDNIKMIASPWSPPAWMKTNNDMHGPGNLRTEYYQQMADYISKFITAYATYNLPIWGVTPQNEPEAGNTGYPGCLYTAEMEANFIKNNLGPTLARHHPNVSILGFDHNRDDLLNWAQTFYSDPDVTQYLWGMAFHWYASQPYFDHVQSTHDLNPGKHLILTEAAECNTGQQDWAKGEQFGYDMINDLNVWAEGFVQWNVILQDNGQGRWGPFEGVNGVNTCQAPIVILNGEVVKKPSYYYIGQISRYLVPGSVRVGADYSFNSQNLYATTFMNPNSDIIMVIMNSNDWAIDMNITDFGRTMIPKVPAHGILTLIYPSWSIYH